jgi:hypothetical protein
MFQHYKNNEHFCLHVFMEEDINPCASTVPEKQVKDLKCNTEASPLDTQIGCSIAAPCDHQNHGTAPYELFNTTPTLDELYVLFVSFVFLFLL